MLPEEPHGALGLGDAELHDAVLEHLLGAVLLHVELAAPQAVVLLQLLSRWRGHGDPLPASCGGKRESCRPRRGRTPAACEHASYTHRKVYLVTDVTW